MPFLTNRHLREITTSVVAPGIRRRIKPYTCTARRRRSADKVRRYLSPIWRKRGHFLRCRYICQRPVLSRRIPFNSFADHISDYGDMEPSSREDYAIDLGVLVRLQKCLRFFGDLVSELRNAIINGGSLITFSEHYLVISWP